ncbi:phosphatidylinositol-binding protein scs2 [Cladochytrium tenue]|nr:phosphatidylinositol-binding protein scs2 [Cladochytrium tenue]
MDNGASTLTDDFGGAATLAMPQLLPLPADAVAIDPAHELEFRRPFSAVVKQVLVIRNTLRTDSIAFKVKTTAPKQYLVRPNSGCVAPGASTEVHVLLQPMKEDPPADFKCKDKFLIQSVRVPPSRSAAASLDTAALAELWTFAEHAKRADPDVVSERKLRCVFLPAGSAASGPADTPIPSDGAAAATPVPAPLPTAAGAQRPADVGDRELREARETIRRLTAACEGYKAEIERLNLLRQRRVGAGAGSASEDAGSRGARRAGGGAAGLALAQPTAGLNVQVVAIIALLAFLLGVYLF